MPRGKFREISQSFVTISGRDDQHDPAVRVGAGNKIFRMSRVEKIQKSFVLHRFGHTHRTIFLAIL